MVLIDRKKAACHIKGENRVDQKPVWVVWSMEF